MTKFQTNDRVRVYWTDSLAIDRSGDGKVVQIWGNVLNVHFDDGQPDRKAHVKQCRKLKPKQKPREWWVKATALQQTGVSMVTLYDKENADHESYDLVHLREVKQK